MGLNVGTARPKIEGGRAPTNCSDYNPRTVPSPTFSDTFSDISGHKDQHLKSKNPPKYSYLYSPIHVFVVVAEGQYKKGLRSKSIDVQFDCSLES